MAESKYSCKDDILCGINMPKDPKALTDLEKKHIPVIDAPSTVKKDELFDINIVVGGIDGVKHPNEPGHFIEWLEVYCGDTFIGRSGFSGGISLGVSRFHVRLSHAHGIIKVRTRCNLHGLWEGTKEIKVED